MSAWLIGSPMYIVFGWLFTEVRRDDEGGSIGRWLVGMRREVGYIVVTCHTTYAHRASGWLNDIMCDHQSPFVAHLVTESLWPGRMIVHDSHFKPITYSS